MKGSLPAFRDDLVITPRLREGDTFDYFVQDSLGHRIFMFGEEETFICKSLNGRTSLEDIQTAFLDRFDSELKLEYLEAFIRHLRTEDLLVQESGSVSTLWGPVSEENKRRLFNPHRFLKFVAGHADGGFSLFFKLVMLAILIPAAGILFRYGSDFLTEWRILWEARFLLILPILGLFVVNVIGEIAKGAACEYYGGQVYECGFFHLFRILPHFYCDIEDALFRMNKKERMRIFFSGPLVQLLFWGVVVIGWGCTYPGQRLHVIFLLLFISSSFFFLLNINPLFDRDGSRLLGNWMEIPDFRNRAMRAAKAWLWGKPLPEPLSKMEIRLFRRYGLLCISFDVLFWGVLLGLAGYLLVRYLQGTGAVFFLILLGLRFEHVIMRMLARFSFKGRIKMKESPAFIRMRLLFRLGLLAILVFIGFLPYPFTVGGDFKLLPQNQLGVRTQVASEVKSVLVGEGQWVTKGQPLALLLGRDQRRKVEEIRAAIDEAEAKLELLRKGPTKEEIARAEQEMKTAATSLEYSTVEAERSERMYRKKALSEKDYEYALKTRDLDAEKLELARKNLELVKSGFRDEEIKAVEAEIRRLNVQLSYAEEDVNLTTLTSPMEGRVITPYLSQTVGQFLAAGDLFVVIEDAGKVIAEIELPEEDVGEVDIGADVTLRTWAYPNEDFGGKVIAVAPVAYEKSRRRIERTMSEKEWIFQQKELLREKGKVVRVLTEIQNEDDLLKTDMTGYAKIECSPKLVGVAFTRWLVRFVMVEMWSWIP